MFVWCSLGFIFAQNKEDCVKSTFGMLTASLEYFPGDILGNGALEQKRNDLSWKKVTSTIRFYSCIEYWGSIHQSRPHGVAPCHNINNSILDV